jgi:hypothetical protein
MDQERLHSAVPDWRADTARQAHAQHYQCKRMTTKSDIASAAATRKKIGATHMT